MVRQGLGCASHMHGRPIWSVIRDASKLHTRCPESVKIGFQSQIQTPAPYSPPPRNLPLTPYSRPSPYDSTRLGAKCMTVLRASQTSDLASLSRPSALNGHRFVTAPQPLLQNRQQPASTPPFLPPPPPQTRECLRRGAIRS